jgi:ABC-type cobalamin/Fe3+-siderophores transport system ATPase subunit
MLAIEAMQYYRVLHEVSASFDNGELVGIIGPNGAGKSTFVKLIAGLLKPDKGRVLLDNIDIHTISAKERAKSIAYLPQQISDQITFTVEEFVSMGRYAYKKLWSMKQDKADERIRVNQAISRFELTYLKHTTMDQISGGERQRAAIARCFAQGARILLLDEPISNLDLFYQIQILKLLQELAKEGYMIIIVLHNLELAARFCTRLFVLRQGRIYRSGQPAAVLTPDVIQDVFRVDAKPFVDPYQTFLRFSIF